MFLKEYGFSNETILSLYAGSSQGNDEFRHFKVLERICLELDKNMRIPYRSTSMVGVILKQQRKF